MLTIIIHVTSGHPQYAAIFSMLRSSGFAVRAMSDGFAVTINDFSQGADVLSICLELGLVA